MRRNHLYHMVDPSPWPIASAFAAFFLLSGAGFWFNRIAYGGLFFLIGLFLTLLCMYF
jgi:cytochrome c oxidase subunit III